jgi:hypothetical protein
MQALMAAAGDREQLSAIHAAESDGWARPEILSAVEQQLAQLGEK